MKNKKQYEKLSRQNRSLFWGGVLTTIIGEKDFVKANPILRTINTAVGVTFTGRSMYNAFKMLDLFDDAEEDVKTMSSHLAKEFVVGPIANSVMLVYSSASEDSKNKIKKKLNLGQ